MADPVVSIVVPVFNGARTIAACLESLLRQDYPADRREILVVDNDSTDGTADFVQRYPVTLLRETQTRGPAAARNRALPQARGAFVAFTDADCLAEKNWLTQALAGFDSERIGCVAGEIRSPEPTTTAQRYATARRLLSQRQALQESFRPYAQTANAVFRRQVLERLGGFDASLPTGEDADLAWRMQEDLGLEITFQEAAVVYHQHRERVRELLRQRVGYGYGSVLLYRKHRARMGAHTLKHTWWEWRSLGRKLGRLCRALGRRLLWWSRPAPEAESVRMVGLEILVFLAQKLGQLQGSIRHRVWYV